MGNLRRRIEQLESVFQLGEGSIGLFTQAEAHKIAEWAGRCAHHYLTFRFCRADGTPAFEGVSSVDHPFVVYMDTCCKALGIELRRYDDKERIEIEPALVIELLPYLESFFHVPGNAEWHDRRAWWIRLNEDQIPREWKYYRSCRPVLKHEPFA